MPLEGRSEEWAKDLSQDGQGDVGLPLKGGKAAQGLCDGYSETGGG